MGDRTLNAAQVAAMLVSTSCGVGFLLGTGEMAVDQGMLGCLYAVATVLGLVMLAVYVPNLWAGGQSVWSRFEQRYGPTVGRNIAVLSLIWMTGVLAAQIRGGSAVLSLTGLPQTSAMLVIVASLLALSVIRLTWLSAGFAICLFACDLVLMHALAKNGGLNIWMHAPVTFAEDLWHSASPHAAFVLLSVALMVVCGADYQQFVIVARRPFSARFGCLLAAAAVLAMGFLPASAVIAAGAARHGPTTADPVQIIPQVLTQGLPGGATGTARDFVVIVLVTTALGSASSILRAMSDATATLGTPSVMRAVWSRALPVFLGTLVASRSQSLVDMMVELNVVYIAAVGPLLALSLLRARIPDAAAKAAMAVACTISLGSYLVRWAAPALFPEPLPLIASFASAFCVAVSYRPRGTISPGTHRPNANPVNAGSCPDASLQAPSSYSGDMDG